MQLRATGATWFSASPTMHRAILAARHGSTAGLRLRFVRCGSAALPRDLAEELREAWGVPVVESYGLTEAHQVASTPLHGVPPRNGAIGPPVGADVSVDGDGQLWLRGPVVAARAVAGDQLTPEQAELLGSGWLPTGDVGSLDADGNVRVHGRIKEMINCGGEKIAPFEVEEVLRTHPGVADVVVFGVPDSTFGEAVACLVVPHASVRLDAAQVRTHVLERLAPVKCPKWVRVTRSIAVGPSGKVVRRRLAEQFVSGKL
jgi:acyl-CoA synthetase (AMP-forming)/AMP-acid ligase II